MPYNAPFEDVGSDCCGARMIAGGTQCENCGSNGIITSVNLGRELLAALLAVIAVGGFAVIIHAV